ncbi:MAG: sugar ABC transporter permease [Clostridiaceae bacterium]|nr:sugar ABC transporter permease [Clostridiaceae bacterium]
MKKGTKKQIHFWLFLLPMLLIFINVIIIPLGIGIVYSFTNWDGFSMAGSKFIGFHNYIKAFSDEKFITAFILTIKYTAIMVILVNVVGLSLALLVTKKMKTSNILRSIFFLPNLIGGLILGFIWQFVFTKLFEFLGTSLHLKGIFFNWIDDPKMAFWALIIVGTWQMAGYVMVIYIAGIQSIPDEVLEAASIDGANALKTFGSIVFPLIIPSFTISVFITLSNSFKQYDTNLSLTNGGPYGSTELVTMNIFNTAFKSNDYAIAQAKSLIFFIVIMILTVLQVYITKKREVEM